MNPAPSISQPRQKASPAPLVVLGNGPSLRGFDFGRLSGVDTLGMNAAYRHWDRIGWRPTHYTCLDDALIDTHWPNILRLLEEGQIRTFFLSGRMLELEPGLAGRENVRFLDEFVPHWYKVRGKQHGLTFIDHAAFRTERPEFVTTGAYSVRYAAYLGYDPVTLLGIDLVYHPLSEARPVRDLRLVITETPASNPNYFFDDYQREGDAFQIPNPYVHEEELHVAAFEAVRDDFVRERLGVQVLNANPQSRLNAEAILPFSDLGALLGEAKLGALVIPLTAGEKEQVLDNLWLWAQPAFFPFLGPMPSRRPDLVFVCNNAAAAARESDVEAFLAGQPLLRDCFADVRFVTLDLSGDADLYQRANHGPPASEGYRAGPNNVFFGAMNALRGHWGHALYMETDCVPIRPDWLGRINAHLQGAEPAWVTGSIYRGSDALGPREKRHINGNAIYAVGDPEFQMFVDKVWRPNLKALIADHPEMPFDCLIEALYERADARRGDEDPDWPMLRSISHKFRYSALIPNLTGDAASLDVLADQVQDLLYSSPDSCIVHTRRLAGLIGSLRQTGARATMVAMLTLMRETAAGLPPSISGARRKGNASPNWNMARVREGLTRRITTLRRFIG